MSERPLSAVILAAGQGTRMRSRTPKVLHPLAGRPMIDLVLDACRAAGVERVVAVVNPAQPRVARHLEGRCEVTHQARQRGTGDALARAPRDLLERGDVLVVNADSPLLRPDTIRRLVEMHRAGGAPATLAAVHDPSREDGRVLRDREGALERIVEARDVTAAERSVGEVNVGLYCFRGGPALLQALASLSPDNQAGELYLTDVFQRLRPVEVVSLDDADEAMGVNDRIQLARAESVLRRRLLEELMLSGVTVVDPASTFVDVGVEVGQDTVLEPFTILRGATSVGSGCRIGPHADVADSWIGDGCRIEHSWLRQCRVAAGADCGPFSKLRAGTEIGESVHVGSFAEIVRSRIGAGSKVPHVSYLGDAVVGENVNIGAGAITANYDGSRKNRTVIGDGSFIGVDTMMVSPLTIGAGSRTGAGSVVTKDVPDGALAVGVPARVIRGRSRAG